MCRVDAEQLDQVPEHGPLLLVCNHINFIEVPLMFTHLKPRPVTGFAKAETWDNPIIGRLFDLWGAIPIRRGEADSNAMRQGLRALSKGKILAVAPEGTRSGDGCLKQGNPGIVSLAQHSNAPILPLVYYGGELYQENLRKLRRTDFHIRVGKLFKINFYNIGSARSKRQRIVDEVMYQLAILLPSQYRGAYSDLSKSTSDYLVFL